MQTTTYASSGVDIMAEGRLIQHHGEAIVLRAWPFHEADLILSIFTREQGKVKGVARHAMKSRRRFGGALEPGTHIIAHYMERPRQELVRLDSFEILWSPLNASVDYLRMAGLQLVTEVLEEALPDLAADDNIFRLALTVLTSIHSGCSVLGASVAGFKDAHASNISLSITYFCLWMNRLMGWMPELDHCVACGLDLRGQTVYWSPTTDGVTCHDDRRQSSSSLSPNSVAESHKIARSALLDLQKHTEAMVRFADLRRFAIGVLERHLDRRLRSATALEL